MRDFDKYFSHIEEKEKIQKKEALKWQFVEKKKDFFPHLVSPALKEIATYNKRFKYENLKIKEENGTLKVTFKIKIIFGNHQSPKKYKLEIMLHYYSEENDLEMHLGNYRSEKEVQFIGACKNCSLISFKEDLEEMFITLYDKDNN